MLKFSSGNSKLKSLGKRLNAKVYGFDLPAGYTCPAADICYAYNDRLTHKIVDGQNMKFRCYAASTENRFPNSARAHWHNYDMLRGKSLPEMVDLISQSLPVDAKIIRIHASGDYFNKVYFLAWVEIAKLNPEITFFGYTKILPYLRQSRPANFHLVYSFGGKLDKFLTDEPTCYIVSNSKVAQESLLPVACQEVDSDDFDYIIRQESFAIVVHGTQPAKK